jgi:hypothetical protein
VSDSPWRLDRVDLIPAGDGILLAASELPDAQAGDPVEFVDRESGTIRSGRVVGLIEQDGAQVIAIEIAGPHDTLSEDETTEV